MTYVEGRFAVSNSSVWGAVAEVLSVLEGSLAWNAVCGHSPMVDYVNTFDTRMPPDERIRPATELIKKIQSTRRIAKWVPWYPYLPNQEYSQQFYSGYRDHSIHILHVFLLGIYLYNTVEPLRVQLNRVLSQGSDMRINERELFLEWWTLTSLWHDTGYPFEANGFITDPLVRERQLSSLSQTLGLNPFEKAIRAYGIQPDPMQLRAFYMAGQYYPLTFNSMDMMLRYRPSVPKIIDEMWKRLQVGKGSSSVLSDLMRITAESPVGRPPYYDHGLGGALLFGILVEETMQFLSNLATARLTDSQVVEKKLSRHASEAWEEFVSLEHIVNMATQAISFHNINWMHIDPVGRRQLLGESEAPPNVSLNNAPHLFFIGLVDTLQDWDRHFFIPQTQISHRPSVRSADMLIQGTNSVLRVALRGKSDSAIIVRKLFSNWLNTHDISTLIQDGATFSLAARITSEQPITLSREHASKEERTRLELAIQNTKKECHEILIKGGERAIVEVANRMDSIHHQILGAGKVLVPADQEAIDALLTDANTLEIEELAHTKIKEGIQLPHGLIERKIGEGGFGKVFLVVSSKSSATPSSNPISTSNFTRRWAFKLLHATDLGHEQKRRLFKRGYQAMNQLNGHPNVVRVFSHSEMPVGFYMDFIPGCDLDTGLLQLDTIFDKLNTALTIADTLAYAHHRNIFHRDIKPGNVLLDNSRDNIPVLTDFDLAWIDGRSQSTQLVYATLAYGAPELFSERLKKWHRKPTVDVYGFGALLYYMLTGQTPPLNGGWTNGHWIEVENRLEGHILAISVKELVELLKKSTMPEPQERIQTMDDVLLKLSSCIARSRSDLVSINANSWLAEVYYRCTGVILTINEFPSRTGGTTWRIEDIRARGNFISFRALCTLNREPYHERVNFEEYQNSTILSVTEIVNKYKPFWKDAKIIRHGRLRNAASTMELEIQDIPMSLDSATAMGNLLAGISRIAE